MTNEQIANALERVAILLEHQGALAHRVRAWRDAAQSIREHTREVVDVFRERGRVGLEAMPHVDARLASAVVELIKTGHCNVLDRLRGDAGRVLERIPGIGPALAARIREQLGIETLEELETAACDGRLARIPGFGERRVAAVRDVLATRLSHARQPVVGEVRPPVTLMLEIDREYRRAAAAGELQRIAPRRLNPTREAWLPVLHVEREGWAFTALFSNTARAHELGRTHDWVIVYYHRANQPEGQATIVTEWSGHLRGERVVRGRERECAHYYGVATSPSASRVA